MTQPFDAQKEAGKIETMARDLMHTHALKNDYPVEQNPIFASESSALAREMKALFSNPEHLRSVAQEFETSNSSTFTLMPHVRINADERGYVTSLHFSGRLLDPQASGEDFYSSNEKPVCFPGPKEYGPPPEFTNQLLKKQS